MFILESHACKGATVLFLRFSSHDTSLCESELASLSVGLVDGQLTASGAYPPDGELGNARPARTRAASAANMSGDAARGRTIPAPADCQQRDQKD